MRALYFGLAAVGISSLAFLAFGQSPWRSGVRFDNAYSAYWEPNGKPARHVENGTLNLRVHVTVPHGLPMDRFVADVSLVDNGNELHGWRADLNGKARPGDFIVTSSLPYDESDPRLRSLLESPSVRPRVKVVRVEFTDGKVEDASL